MKRWYLPGKFLPRGINDDLTYQRLPDGAKKVYRFLCWHSYLTKKSPSRRYCRWTKRQIAQQVGLSDRWVKHCLGLLRKGRFVWRYYTGDSGTTTTKGKPRPQVYEVPASRRQIIYWRIHRKPWEVK